MIKRRKKKFKKTKLDAKVYTNTGKKPKKKEKERERGETFSSSEWTAPLLILDSFLLLAVHTYYMYTAVEIKPSN